ncbi:MAG: Crp/Fnr family transcriptional regulator [Bacteroidetes bacterium]|nr:MAG: Crp/Fnr family transcriptional regulator [Bacteroidota bacterium]
MDTREIKKAVEANMPLSSRSFEEFMTIAEEYEVPAGDVFIVKGRREHYEYLVMDGICRSFVLDPDGAPVTIAFFWEHSVLSPYVTRTKKGISTLDFEALTDLKLIRFPEKEFLDFMVDNIEIREWGNEVLKKELAQKVEKEINLATLTARDRLIKFREQFPPFENLIPHPAIASYLGITNVSLSRLRKNTF